MSYVTFTRSYQVMAEVILLSSYIEIMFVVEKIFIYYYFEDKTRQDKIINYFFEMNKRMLSSYFGFLLPQLKALVLINI